MIHPVYHFGMDRFAFSINETDKRWLEDRSDELGISAAELLRRIVADARESDTPVNHRDTPSDTDGARSDSLGDTDVNHRDTPSDTVRDSLDAHEERIADLEARVDDLEADTGGESDGVGAWRAIGGEEPLGDPEPEVVDDVREALEGWSHGRNKDERQRNREVAATALAWLRARDGAVRKGDAPLEAWSGDRKVDTIWLEVIRDAWLHAAERGFVEHDSGKHTYEWVGGPGDARE